jgi:hypothetical protein
VSIQNIFSLYDDKKPDYLTQVVIEHLLANRETRNDFKQFLQRYWSLAERSDSLRKHFLNEVMHFLPETGGRYPTVIKAILTDWAQYAAYTLVEWTEIYTALETNELLPPHCNDVSRTIYHTASRYGWKKHTNGAASYEQGGEMLRNGVLIICLIWLEYPEYRQDIAISGASAQVTFHALTYSVDWKKVAQALDAAGNPPSMI